MPLLSLLQFPTLILTIFILLTQLAHADEPIPLKPAQSFDIPPYIPGQITTSYTPYIYAQAEQHKLHLFVFSPAKTAVAPRAAILLFHSGGWVRGRPEWLFGLARQFADDGLVAIPVQYRLSGSQATPADALADACAAFRWVRAHAGILTYR